MTTLLFDINAKNGLNYFHNMNPRGLFGPRCILGQVAELNERGFLRPELLDEFDSLAIDAWQQSGNVFEFFNSSGLGLVRAEMTRFGLEPEPVHSCRPEESFGDR